ncbi:unnamed protein product, partial [Brachionus calyciflorus]
FLAPFFANNTSNRTNVAKSTSINQENKAMLEYYDENINDVKPKKSSYLKTYLQNVYNFLHSPSIVFIYDSIAYIVFLCLFSYFILCEFRYTETVVIYEYDKNETSLTELDKTEVKTYPGVYEYVLLIWILSLTIEELRQFFQGENHIRFKLKLLRYFRDKWNYLDILGCLFFAIGFILRVVSIWTTEKVFMFAKISFCIDLTIWYLRLLHVSLVFKSLGPKLVMIQKMIRDLIFFMCLIAIFVCAFGITTEAALYPSSNFDLNLFRRILTKGYWPVYGTIKILEDFDRFSANCTGRLDCPEPHGLVYSYIVLMIYMVVANVLLVNLLIAMFSSTFQRVHENTDLIWKFQRYALVYEYVEAPVFPAPFCMVIYLFKAFRTIFKRMCRKKFYEEESYFGNNSLNLIQTIEKKSSIEYLELKQEQMRRTIDAILKWNSEKLELLEQKLNTLLENKVTLKK